MIGTFLDWLDRVGAVREEPPVKRSKHYHPFSDDAEAIVTMFVERHTSPHPIGAYGGTSERAQDVSNGMVAFYPDPDVAENLAVDGGERAEDLHITLAFLPSLDDGALDRVRDVVRGWAASTPPLTGKVQGVGKFATSHKDTPVTYAVPDVPGLTGRREGLVGALLDAGVEVGLDHGFTPHITLAYDDLGDHVPPGVDLAFDTVTVRRGIEERWDLQLLGQGPRSRNFIDWMNALSRKEVWDESEVKRDPKGQFAKKEGRLPKVGDVNAPAGALPDLSKPDNASPSIPPLSDLKLVEDLGGTTGAKLYKSEATGQGYVVKKGTSPAHIREEMRADAAYRALGIKVPAFRADEKGQVAKIAEHVEGSSHQKLAKSDFKWDHAALIESRERLAMGFWADALLANWDVTGTDDDNVLVDMDGEPWRIDNGGALRYRAQGNPKGAAFGETVGEINSMRGKNPKVTTLPANIAAFGGLSDEDVAKQIKENMTTERRVALMNALDDDPELESTLAARWDYMHSWADITLAGDAGAGSAGTVTKTETANEIAAKLAGLALGEETVVGYYEVKKVVGSHDVHTGAVFQVQTLGKMLLVGGTSMTADVLAGDKSWPLVQENGWATAWTSTPEAAADSAPPGIAKQLLAAADEGKLAFSSITPAQAVATPPAPAPAQTVATPPAYTKNTKSIADLPVGTTWLPTSSKTSGYYEIVGVHPKTGKKLVQKYTASGVQVGSPTKLQPTYVPKKVALPANVGPSAPAVGGQADVKADKKAIGDLPFGTWVKTPIGEIAEIVGFDSTSHKVKVAYPGGKTNQYAANQYAEHVQLEVVDRPNAPSPPSGPKLGDYLPLKSATDLPAGAKVQLKYAGGGLSPTTLVKQPSGMWVSSHGVVAPDLSAHASKIGAADVSEAKVVKLPGSTAFVDDVSEAKVVKLPGSTAFVDPSGGVVQWDTKMFGSQAPPPRYAEAAVGDDADRLLRKWQGDVQLTDAEVQAFAAYTNGEYGAINGHLRDSTSPSTNVKTARAIARMDGVIAKAPPFQEPVVLSRKTDLQSWKTAQLDTVIHDNGFLSTSTSGGTWAGGIHLKILAPAGTRGLMPKLYLGADVTPDENEVILARGTQFEVRERRELASGEVVLFVEVIV